MIARPESQRIVITGVGLTAPGANNLAQFRANLLAGASGVRKYEIRYVGDTVAGTCDFEELRHQTKKDVRRGTRAGSIGVYCSREAIADSGLDWPNVDKIECRRLRRRHRAWQRRNRKRNLSAQIVRLRHQVLVASS